MRRLGGGGLAAAGMVLLVAVLAGCSGRGGAGAATTTTVGRQDRVAVLREAVRCARQNGMPDLPDPQIDSNGEAHFPGGDPGDPPERVQRACGAIFQRLEAAASGGDTGPADLPALVRFATCLREHGFPGLPDPGPDGNFPVDALPRGFKPGNPSFDAAMRACRRLNPDPEGDVHVR